jgi:hypothetical protein
MMMAVTSSRPPPTTRATGRRKKVANDERETAPVVVGEGAAVGSSTEIGMEMLGASGPPTLPRADAALSSPARFRPSVLTGVVGP